MGVIGRHIGKQATKKATEPVTGPVSHRFTELSTHLPELTIADVLGFAAHSAVLGEPTRRATSLCIGEGKHADATISENSIRTTLRSEIGLRNGSSAIELSACDGVGNEFLDWKLRASLSDPGTTVDLEVPAFRTREDRIVNEEILESLRLRFAAALAGGVEVDIVDSLDDIDNLVMPTILEKSWNSSKTPFEFDHLRTIPDWVVEPTPLAMPAGSADILESALRAMGGCPWAATSTARVSVQREAGGGVSLLISQPEVASPSARQRSFRVAVSAINAIAGNLEAYPHVQDAVRGHLNRALSGWDAHDTSTLTTMWDRETPTPSVRLPLAQFPVAVTLTGHYPDDRAHAMMESAAKRTLIVHRLWTRGLRSATREANMIFTARRFMIASAGPGKVSGWGRFTHIGDARPEHEVIGEIGQRGWWWEVVTRNGESADGRMTRTLLVTGLSHSSGQVMYGTELLTLLRGFVDRALVLDPSTTARVVRVVPFGDATT